jgi:hypothetical protein
VPLHHRDNLCWLGAARLGKGCCRATVTFAISPLTTNQINPHHRLAVYSLALELHDPTRPATNATLPARATAISRVKAERGKKVSASSERARGCRLSSVSVCFRPLASIQPLIHRPGRVRGNHDGVCQVDCPRVLRPPDAFAWPGSTGLVLLLFMLGHWMGMLTMVSRSRWRRCSRQNVPVD